MSLFAACLGFTVVQLDISVVNIVIKPMEPTEVNANRFARLPGGHTSLDEEEIASRRSASA